MKNFARAMRMALNYPWSIAVGIFSSVMIALLWGANIGAVYPFVEVVLNGKSMHQWVDEGLEKTTIEKNLLDEQTEQLIHLLDAKKTGIEPEIPAPSPNVEIKNGTQPSQTDWMTSLGEAELTKQLAWTRRQAADLQKKQAWLNSVEPSIKKYLPDNPFLILVLIIAMVVAGTLLKSFFLVVNMYLVAHVSKRTVLNLQNEFYRKTLHMDLASFGERGTGDMAGRIRSETNQIGKAIQTLLGKTMREPLKMAVCVTGAAYINWRLLLFSMLVVPMAAYLMLRLTRSIKRANLRAMEESANLMNRLFQSLTYIKVVKSNNMEGHERTRFNRTTNEVYFKGMKIAVYNSFFRINNEILGVFVVSFSILAGGYLVLNQETHIFGIQLSDYKMQFSDLLVFYALVVGISDPLRKMSDVYNSFQAGIVACDRIFPIMDQPSTIVSPVHAAEIPAKPALLEFQNVCFHYTPDIQVLDHVSFTMQPGESIAIVGANGSGKSTLINLLPRFYDVTSGSIKLDGKNIHDYRIRDMRRHISVVNQMTMLFDDTIANNIRYGVPGATDEQVREAAIQAHAHEFIVKNLEKGYDSLVGEHGGKLSGGQRQRISLVCAILRNTPLLILDEATSQIDPESEQLIHQTLKKLVEDRSVIMVTHRASTLDLAEKILVLKSGRVVDFGSHEELVNRCATYAKFRNVEYRETA